MPTTISVPESRWTFFLDAVSVPEDEPVAEPANITPGIPVA